MPSFFRGAALIPVLLVTYAGSPSFAQQERVPAVEQQTPAPVLAQDNDARETRERFENILRRLPPAVGRVLKTDPMLMSNETYLATYPALAAFLRQYPEVRHNPAYYLANVNQEFWDPPRERDPRDVAISLWRDTMQVFAVFSGFVVVTLSLIWIVRTLVEYRRWFRVSKVHAEVHNKLLDRFTSNEDMLAYIQTPAARRFLESAPLPIDGARPVGAPVNRILWSVQAGIVLASGALGLLFISTRVIDEVAQPIFGVGVLALTVGIGFVVSAAGAFLLSRRLGLFDPGAPPREHSAEVTRP
jgi:hypothetical protein